MFSDMTTKRKPRVDVMLAECEHVGIVFYQDQDQCWCARQGDIDIHVMPSASKEQVVVRVFEWLKERFDQGGRWGR